MSSRIPENIQYVKGVGPKRAEILKKMNIESVQDLLYYFPRDYEDRRQTGSIEDLKPGKELTLKVRVEKIKTEKVRPGLSILRVYFSDDSGTISGVWFNQNYLKNVFSTGEMYYVYGSPNQESLKYNKTEINNPIFEKVTSDQPIHLKRVVPIYSLTSGLTQKQLRKIIYHSLQDYAGQLVDILPDVVKNKFELYNLEHSLRQFHFPDNRQEYIFARRRLAFEELFLLQLAVLKRKEGIIKDRGVNHDDPGQIIASYLGSLSFELTAAQKRVWREIKNDMETPAPMQRLLQGDVGSGKTVIAVLSLIETMANGYQGVFMAPTEILAEQHYLKLEEKLNNLGFETVLLVGSIKNSQRKKIIEKIAASEVDLIIGTHALFQEGIDYNNIGLVVIDEQHRFGVEQRYELKEKGDNPDLLVMTATPIPRSLALTLYGDLDLSLIDQLPPGRKPVKTSWRGKEARANVYKFVREKLAQGRQAFVVCPLIEPSDEISALSAAEAEKELKNTLLSGYKTGILHSKLAPEEKKTIMKQFREGEIDILVSTTVVEVGVDIPNASLMVIEDGQRFGLSQLHQLRGRVGRGEYQSYCIVIAEPTTDEARKRLSVFTETGDGFKIAEEDLKIRGPGEFFGTEQHGMPDLRVASIIKDKKLLNLARNEAENLINEGKLEDNHPALFRKLKKLELKV